ncbi:glycosyltransferase [Belnapia rosea]|uniref:glycosyltransferase n=1 Tax=Belnapia rosea TaxID=938405 RepID=UPI0015A4A152|nr:glycosyltransferase [Belnapia rosea]
MSRAVFHLDHADRKSLAGWAYDVDRPERHICIIVLDGTEYLTEVTANTFRKDLEVAGVGTGDHAFHLALPSFLQQGPALRLRLIDADTRAVLAVISFAAEFEPAGQLLRRLGEQLQRELGEAGAQAERSLAARTLLDGMLPLLDSLLQAAQPALDESPLPDGPFQAALAAARERFPPVTLRDHAAPRVSIIIPVFGKFELTHACLATLSELPDTTPYEVILVDDGSVDETLLAPLLIRHLRLLRNRSTLGFLRSCNAGAAMARGELLYFLNNDTELQPGSLDALVTLLEEEPETGIVGSKLINKDGTLQEAGGIILRLADGVNYGRGGDPLDGRFNYRRDADYVSGASLMTRRAVFDQLGGFDEEFLPAYYEDTDYCFRARAAGWRVRYQPRSAVIHLEGGTGGTDLAVGPKRHQVVNARRFLQRWRKVLLRHAPAATAMEREKDRGAAFRMLFIDATVPTPRQDAGSAAAACHIRLLQHMGAKVTFIAASHMGLQGEDGEALQDAGIEVLHHPFAWSVEEVLRRRKDEFDVIYLHRGEVAVRHIAICRALAPKARIVYSVADLHFLRLERQAELGDAGPAPAIDVRREAEMAAIMQADAVIVHSSAEASVLRACMASHVEVVPWAVPLVPDGPGHAERQGLLFVGGFRHPPNSDGIRWFVQRVWPGLRDRLPELTLTIVGSHMPDEIRALGAQPGITVAGYVEELAPLYAAHRLAVAPLRYGAGLKGKVIEALATGLPCIGTPIAYEGIGLPCIGSVQAAGEEEFILKLAALYKDAVAWHAVRETGLAFARSEYSEAAVTAGLQRAIGALALPAAG